MYGLRQDIDLSFLKGREVGQVAIGTCEVIFAFDEDVRITVYAEFKYFDGDQEWIWKSEAGKAQIAALAVAILGSTIDSFEGRSDGTLTLNFANRHRLTILDSSNEFESYDITRPGQTIVV